VPHVMNHHKLREVNHSLSLSRMNAPLHTPPHTHSLTLLHRVLVFAPQIFAEANCGKFRNSDRAALNLSEFTHAVELISSFSHGESPSSIGSLIEDMVEHGRAPSRRGKPMANADVTRGESQRRMQTPEPPGTRGLHHRGPSPSGGSSRSRSASPRSQSGGRTAPAGGQYETGPGLPQMKPPAYHHQQRGADDERRRLRPVGRMDFARQVHTLIITIHRHVNPRFYSRFYSLVRSTP